jgi:hypothetical protein
MHVVVICRWKEETPELVQALALTLGITAFEARPRLNGGGPAVAAGFADPERAQALAKKLDQIGFETLVIDSAMVRGRAGHFIVRRFELYERSLRIETGDGQQADIPWQEIDLFIPATSIVEYSGTKTITEHKLSLGKTMLYGGIPMTKKIEHKEEVSTEERGKVLYLYACRRQPAFFSQNGMSYDGLGPAMKMSRELNFNHLVSELRRFAPRAVFDDRLVNRAGQVRMLGPALKPEISLDLAAEILARTLRREVPGPDW